jgi:hypothetical protein
VGGPGVVNRVGTHSLIGTAYFRRITDRVTFSALIMLTTSGTIKQHLTSLKAVLLSNTIQFDTLYRLLIDKGIFTGAAFDEKLKKVQTYYQDRSSNME